MGLQVPLLFLDASASLICYAQCNSYMYSQHSNLQIAQPRTDIPLSLTFRQLNLRG